MLRFLISITAVLFAACSVTSSAPSLIMTESITEESDEPHVSFVTFGDWGYEGASYQRDVATAISNYCLTEECDFILTLGDNFYDDGVTSVDDPLWQSLYIDVYHSLELPFYAIVGNHDTLQGTINAQIAYSDIDPYWRLPAVDYTFSAPEGSATPLVQFFVNNSDESVTQERADFFDEALTESTASWKFLVRHHPFTTNQNISGGDDALLEKTICNRHDLTLSAHNHLFSYLRGDKAGCWLEQFIIGTGGHPLQEQISDRDEGRLVTTASVHGFGWFQIYADRILFRMITSDGSTNYQVTLTRIADQIN